MSKCSTCKSCKSDERYTDYLMEEDEFFEFMCELYSYNELYPREGDTVEMVMLAANMSDQIEYDVYMEEFEGAYRS